MARCFPPFPVVPRTTWHGSGTTTSSRALGAEVAIAVQLAIEECWRTATVVVVAVLRCCTAGIRALAADAAVHRLAYVGELAQSHGAVVLP